MENTLLDFSKLRCKRHPMESVSNFCTNSTLALTKTPAWLSCALSASASILKCT